MAIALFDTLSRAVRTFVPADPKRVTMYVCGPTVYSHAHIGNFRAAVAFDLLYRLLRHEFGADAVVYARNLTDIDDKIIRAARETGEPISAVTTKYARLYREETAALGVLPPTMEPLATENIPAMINLITRLLARGAAYEAERHVLFSVAKAPGYGALSGVDRDEMLAGARVEVAPYKVDAADFVLWKPSSPDEPGWDSPWGRGRPGWHIECSAMIEEALGQTIDIHGGGQDLRFPHHENELAQSSCVHDGAPLARYWMHNGFLRMGAEKMSKSLGNVALPRDLLRAWPGEALRFALLSAHYRQPLEWTDGLIEQSRRQLDRFYRALAEAPGHEAVMVDPPASVVLALHDDLNSPEAIAGLHSLRDIVVQTSDPAAKARAAARLKAAGALMGFLSDAPDAWFKRGRAEDDGLSDGAIEALIAERAQARKAKDFARSDQIRNDLLARGIILEDGPGGAKWRRA